MEEEINNVELIRELKAELRGLNKELAKHNQRVGRNANMFADLGGLMNIGFMVQKKQQLEFKLEVVREMLMREEKFLKEFISKKEEEDIISMLNIRMDDLDMAIKEANEP